MKVKRNIIEIDKSRCDGCGLCVTSCAEGAIEIADGKASLISDVYCDGLGACIGECPKDALKIVEREADEFDHEAVEKLMELKIDSHQTNATMACGCPSSMIRVLAPQPANRDEAEPCAHSGTSSALSHWPIQISLVPPEAPFLKGADILVAADCTPFAYPRFHSDFLKERTLLVGCPKLDDAVAYIRKFTQIFSRAEIKSVTLLVMEVPCCQGFSSILKKALNLSGKNIPMEKITISQTGKVLRKESV